MHAHKLAIFHAGIAARAFVFETEFDAVILRGPKPVDDVCRDPVNVFVRERPYETKPAQLAGIWQRSP